MDLSVIDNEVQNHMFLFISKKNSNLDEVIEQFTKSAENFKGKFLFITVDCDDVESESALLFFGVKNGETGCFGIRGVVKQGVRETDESVDDEYDRYTFEGEERGIELGAKINDFARQILEGGIKSDDELSKERKLAFEDEEIEVEEVHDEL